MKSFNQWLSEDPYVTDPQTNKSLVGRIANVRKKTFDVDIEGKHLIRCAKVNDPNLSLLAGRLEWETFRKGRFASRSNRLGASSLFGE